MSYILDALRKSEQERRQADPATALSEGPRAIDPPARAAGAPVTVLAAVAAVGILAGAWWVFSADLQPAAVVAASGPAEAAPREPARADAAAASGESTPVRSAMAPEAPKSETTEESAPELKPSPFAAAPRRGPVHDLGRQARIEEPAPAAAAPARQAAARPAAPEPAPPVPLKFLHAMPDEFRGALPSLAVTIHIYAPRAADRILYINNRQYRAGDRVGEGIRLEQIVEDGAVLSYRGQRFKLPRPS